MNDLATTESPTLDNPPPDIAKTLRNTSNGAGRELALIQKSSSPLAENRWLQRLIFSAACVKGLDATKLSHLARAHCVLVETNLRLRGIPSPGQLRPDLDPVQLKRAMKRARGRQPIDIANEINSAAGAGMLSDDDETPASGDQGAEQPKKKVSAKSKIELDTPPANPPIVTGDPPEPTTDGAAKESL